MPPLRPARRSDPSGTRLPAEYQHRPAARGAQLGASLAGARARRARRPPQPLLEPSTIPHSKNDPDRERVGKDEPDRASPSRASEQRLDPPASDAPSSPCARSASAGVPHAGQPSTPNTVTSRPSSAQRVAEPADGRVVLEHEEPRSASSASSHSASKRLSHGMFTTASPTPRSASSSDAVERLVQHHRPVREQDGVRALAQTRAAPDARAAVELDPPRRRPDREPDRDVLLRLARPPSAGARASPRRSPAARSSCSGSAPSSEMSRTRLVRLPGPGRDEPGVVERVDRPSSARSPGCRSARSRATRGTTRTS